MALPPRKGLFQRLTDALFEETNDAPTPARPPAPARPPTGRSPPPPAPAATPKSPAPPAGEAYEDPPWAAATAKAKADREATAQAGFEARLNDLVDHQKPGTAGKMTLFGLEQIRAELGDRWEALADRARQVAEQVVQKRLGSHDVYAPFDDDTFLILFADLSEDQAAVKLASMAKEVHDRLLGIVGDSNRHWVRALVSANALGPAVTPPRTLADLDAALTKGREVTFTDVPTHAAPPVSVRQNPAEAAAARVKLGEKVEEAVLSRRAPTAGKMQFLDLEQIRTEFGARWEQIAEKAQAIVEQVIRGRIDPADVMAPYDDDSYLILFAELDEVQARVKIQALAREIRERLLGELQLGDEEGVKAFVTALPDEKPPIGGAFEWLGRALDVTLNVVPKPNRKVGDREAAARAGEISASYRPTLFVAKGVVSVHECRAYRMDGAHRILAGNAAYPRSDSAVTFEVDRAVLDQACRDLQGLIASGGAGVIQVPVHVASLLAHSNFLLVDLVRALRVEARRLLVLDLLGGEVPGLIARFSEAVHAIQPFCRAVAARVPVEFRGFDELARVGVGVVGIDLDGHPSTGADLENAVRRFVGEAQRHKLSTFVFGVADPKSLAALRTCGVTYLNGTAVAHETLRPRALHTWIAPRQPAAARGG